AGRGCRAGGGAGGLGRQVAARDVETRLRLALAGDARADDLGEPVDVVRPAAERLLESRAHPLGPRLGAEHPVAEAEGLRVAALGGEALGDVEDEGRG